MVKKWQKKTSQFWW